MKTRIFSLLTALALPIAMSAQDRSDTRNSADTRTRTDASTHTSAAESTSTNIGNMSREEFMRRNREGGALVQAIQPTSTPLSKEDQKLMMKVAMGGMMQLQVSQAALGKVGRDDVRILAQSEVEEQTALAAKLQEIARAKGMTLPATPDPETRGMLEKMQGMRGADLDRHYTRSSGVKGHMKLEKTMSKVMDDATDPALKALAAATLPVIRMHMQVSQQVLDQMGRGGGTAATTR